MSTISPRGVGGVIILLLIMHEVILTDCVRGPFSATHISFSDQILVRKNGDTKTSVSSTTLVVHENPSTPSSPSPSPSPSPGLAIIARGTHHSPRRSFNLPSKVKIRHTVLHMRKDGDTNTLVVHEKPTTPSSPSPSPSPGLAIIARGVGFLNPPSRVLMNRSPSPIVPTCLPDCK